MLVAQAVDPGGTAGWLIIGGALVVLVVGLVMVVFARAGRRDEVDDRIAVRSEASEVSEARPAPAARCRFGAHCMRTTLVRTYKGGIVPEGKLYGENSESAQPGDR